MPTALRNLLERTVVLVQVVFKSGSGRHCIGRPSYVVVAIARRSETYHVVLHVTATVKRSFGSNGAAEGTSSDTWLAMADVARPVALQAGRQQPDASLHALRLSLNPARDVSVELSARPAVRIFAAGSFVRCFQSTRRHRPDARRPLPQRSTASSESALDHDTMRACTAVSGVSLIVALLLCESVHGAALAGYPVVAPRR